MEIVIASDQERPNLFAELHVAGQAWAELIYDAQKEAYLLTVFPGEDGEWLTFDLAEVRKALVDAEVRKALVDAKDALVARGYPDLRI
jgi:hypothetical protein